MQGQAGVSAWLTSLDPSPERIALIGAGMAPLERLLREKHPSADVRSTGRYVRSIEALHVWLSAFGPSDVVIDSVGPLAVPRLWRLLFHVRAETGAYVLVSNGADPQPWESTVRRLQELKEERRDRAGIEIEQRHSFVLVRHQANTLSTIRDRQASRVLRLRQAAGDVVAEIPGVTFDSIGVVTSNVPDAWNLLPSRIEAGPLALRRWQRPVCHAGQIVVDGQLLLPASLNRGTRARRLGHARLPSVGRHFVSAPDPQGDVEPLPGPWFYLDNVARGHFGHALSEQLSMTWGWSHALREDAHIRALVSVAPGEDLAAWEYELLAAAGLARDRVRCFSSPVQPEILYTATAMFHRPSHIHPAITATYDGVGSSLAVRATGRDWPDKVFLSRRSGRRSCLNRAEVEDFHRDHGFEVVQPADLSLPDQVQLVRRAEVISGFAGSGMFQIALAGGPKRVIAITSTNYHAHNEQLFSAVLGHHLDLVQCTPVIPKQQRFSQPAFHSDFRLDWRTEGRFLRQALQA